MPMMPPTILPLRCETTRDHQWWCASPIECAAANGHYDVVRELLHIDPNHLIDLTSLRRIRRLETIWVDNDDNEERSHNIAERRCHVARQLLLECDSRSKDSLLRSGHGGWLMYTAASGGDLSFVRELLERDPSLVFGEGEYGVTDILYAASTSKSNDVFRMVLDFAVSPRLLTSSGGEVARTVYKWEVMTRAIHAAAGGGNLEILKELLVSDYCSDVLAFRDAHDNTILHSAAAEGRVEVVEYLIQAFDMLDSIDDQGNTALHVAAHKAWLPTIRALGSARPSSVSSRNAHGETLLHMAVSGLQTPEFRRLDAQIDMMKQLLSGEAINTEGIINSKNNEGRTALHMSIIGNVHHKLVEILMSAQAIDLNVPDKDGMTPLDWLKRRPRSVSRDVLVRKLISAGGVSAFQEISSPNCSDTSTTTGTNEIIKMLGIGKGSITPGRLFRIADSEMLLRVEIEDASDAIGYLNNAGINSSSFDSTNENSSSCISERPASASNVTARLKKFMWPMSRAGKQA